MISRRVPDELNVENRWRADKRQPSNNETEDEEDEVESPAG